MWRSVRRRCATRGTVQCRAVPHQFLHVLSFVQFTTVTYGCLFKIAHILTWYFYGQLVLLGS
jgi:hypothetical protein